MPLLCFMIISLTLAGQNFNTKQATLVIKKTADWCPFCGTYGWDFFKGLYDDVKADPNAILVAMHYSGGLQNNAALQITNNYNAPGQPVFIVNNTDILVNSSNVSSKISETKNTIQTNDSRNAAIALDLNLLKINGSKFQIQVHAQAMQDLGGIETYVGFYRVKNNVIHNQASRSATASHINVLEGAFPGSTVWGEALFTGTISKGTIKVVSQEIDAFPTNADTKIMALVWNKLPSGKYSFLNGQIISTTEITTSNREIIADETLDARFDGTYLQVNWGGNSIEKCILINTLGQASDLTLISGNDTRKSYQLPEGIGAGTYYVRVQSGRKLKSKAVIIQR